MRGRLRGRMFETGGVIRRCHRQLYRGERSGRRGRGGEAGEVGWMGRSTMGMACGLLGKVMDQVRGRVGLRLTMWYWKSRRPEAVSRTTEASVRKVCSEPVMVKVKGFWVEALVEASS